MSDDLVQAATPGTVIAEKYRVESVIGRGGMGVILAATHVSLDRRVAIKVLSPKALKKAPQRFEREAQIAARIASPNVAQVLDFGMHQGAPFLVMEHLDGWDLEEELRRRASLPQAEAVDVVLEACVGLAHAHALDLVHRDVKPANLFLARTQSGRRVVKVLDFGLTKDVTEELGSLTLSSDVFGTPQYMSPEQIESSKKVDARCDQHALGLILFELLSGKHAYAAETLPQLIVKIATKEPLRLSDVEPTVSPALAEVVTRALAKAPGDRFPSLAELAAALAPFGSRRAPALAEEVSALLGGAPPSTVLARTPVIANRSSRPRTDSLSSADTVLPIREALAEHRAPAALTPTLELGGAETVRAGSEVLRRPRWPYAVGGVALVVIVVALGWGAGGSGAPAAPRVVAPDQRSAALEPSGAPSVRPAAHGELDPNPAGPAGATSSEPAALPAAIAPATGPSTGARPSPSLPAAAGGGSRSLPPPPRASTPPSPPPAASCSGLDCF